MTPEKTKFALPSSVGSVISIGPLQAAPLSKVIEEERENAQRQQAEPVTTSMAQHVRKAWMAARDAKRNTVETRMLQSVRARRGVYDPEKLHAIREMGGSDVYAMLTSVKCRAAASWLRDVLMANGTEKPWTIRATPVPELNPEMNESVIEAVAAPMAEAQMTGQPMPDQQVIALMGSTRDLVMNKVREQARVMAERMENKMEDQLAEGGLIHALNQFIDDIVTYPAAIIKGPVVRNKVTLEWKQTRGEFKPTLKKKPVLEWERVSPFDIFPSAEAESVDDGYLIQKHRLSRGELWELIGVKNYDEAAIRLVLEEYGNGGLREWLYDDQGQAEAEGKSQTEVITNPDQLIDALQYWGSIQGDKLREYGMTEEEIPDPLAEYSVEIWLIGHYVIKATLNHHPLGKKPYYKTCYEEIPGSFWGNSPADLVRDAQTVVNAATRALVNNMGLASGPQVVVNVDRLAAGEEISTLTPWKIWQVTNDAVTNGHQLPPIAFNQPQSNVPELSGIIEKFMEFADEWSGIPRYLTGDAPGGAGRTASGLSMLMNNAGKSLKQVVSNVDNYVFRPMLEQLHFWNMQYAEDTDLKGDINIVVRGANALVAKEAAALRRNEFLNMTNNPVDHQIVGLEGRAAVLREVAKGLDMDTDNIVPPKEVFAMKVKKQQQEQIEQQAAMAGAEEQAKAQAGGGQELMDGSPVTDNFSPPQQN